MESTTVTWLYIIDNKKGAYMNRHTQDVIQKKFFKIIQGHMIGQIAIRHLIWKEKVYINLMETVNCGRSNPDAFINAPALFLFLKGLCLMYWKNYTEW